MKVTIEHVFCRYSDEATDIYFRIINTILFFNQRSGIACQHGTSENGNTS